MKLIYASKQDSSQLRQDLSSRGKIFTSQGMVIAG